MTSHGFFLPQHVANSKGNGTPGKSRFVIFLARMNAISHTLQPMNIALAIWITIAPVLSQNNFYISGQMVILSSILKSIKYFLTSFLMSNFPEVCKRVFLSTWAEDLANQKTHLTPPGDSS